MIGFGTLQATFSGNLLQLLEDCHQWCVEHNKNIIIDTAQSYANSECIIGQYIKNNKDALKYFKIVTKGGVSFNPSYPYHSLEEIEHDLNESLNRLQVNKIHCYMIHRLNPQLFLDDIIIKLSEHKDKFDCIGFSEVTLEELKTLHYLSEKYGVKLGYMEYAVSPFVKRIEEMGIVKYCQDNDIKIISYTSTLRGMLNNKILQLENYMHLLNSDFRDALFEILNIGEMERTVGIYDLQIVKNNVKIVIDFIKFANRLGLDANVLSLMYNTMKGYISIPGTTSRQHLYNNLNSSLSLDVKLIEAIDHITRGFEGNPNPASLSYLDTIY
ncbi:Aldo/Keto reductase [Orpheovirus IHUMI-LCC2]|uniref:Aldo/Keto reductase n=1 Tax=Orpheovirus IHUMI-LCC2 TaxID=2023057 RepID=A0A2I2L334_9VIRU|nr:Aldo/Keto reductase [Orpheovirus IHUMI-LCC2]SNW61955.1 Aldo/Keto reductase [Orpheovirus IHUMI-LCC2]